MTAANVLECPHCRASVANAPSIAGQVVQCPHCPGQFTMPALVPVRAVAPPVESDEATIEPVGPTIKSDRPASFLIETAPKQKGVGSQHRKRKQSITPLHWVLGGLCLLFGLALVGAVTGPPPGAERRAKERRLAAELPDSAAGHDWRKASSDAKARFVERFETTMSDSRVIAGVDLHYELASNSTHFGSLDDSVVSVIRQVVADERKAGGSRTSEYRTAYETDVPEWKRKGFRSEFLYQDAKEINRDYGQPMDQVRAAQEMLIQQGF